MVDPKFAGAPRTIIAGGHQQPHAEGTPKRQHLPRHIAGADDTKCLAGHLIGAVDGPATRPLLGLKMAQPAQMHKYPQKGELCYRTAMRTARSRADYGRILKP